MFILPAHAAPFALSASASALGEGAHRAWWTLPLTLLATLVLLALVRAVTVLYPRRAPALPVAVLEKAALAQPATRPKSRTWLRLPAFISAPAPSTTAPASDASLPTPAAACAPSPPAQTPPAGRGRPAARAGAVRRPEPALSVRARVEAPCESPLASLLPTSFLPYPHPHPAHPPPLRPAFTRITNTLAVPAIYECQTPVSMAKMIMSRHTYRRPTSPAPAPAPSPARRASVSVSAAV
ncbi:hypothetical protein C8F04DRAFT_1141819 [Mycena alexandri]|uniref:Uncharacterized protein n=1 Tax=Mycena alexandri TaxID=1745969 RepID=A0AAD6S4Q9_9AGAR|nr:hypothetical protein C8F04DRAFT_1141819 [Mycena alexandri]